MTNKSKDERFKAFVTELEDISVKYGITVQSVGGVTIFDVAEEPMPTRVVYSTDYTSGDLLVELVRT